MIPVLRFAVYWVISLLLFGCSSTPVEPAVAEQTPPQLPPVIVSTQPPAEVDRLDVGIVVFDPGIPADASRQRQLGVYPLIRKAESRYLPFLLRQTLVGSGQWGVVRVMPKTHQSSELVIEGTIRQSDGETLALAIEARDSAGRVWLDKTYSDTATEEDYSNDAIDPFQRLFNEITNDLLVVRSGLTHRQRQDIAQVATVRYGAGLSPETFNEYLLKDEAGIYQVRRLPAEDDPMLERIERIRKYEYLFIDTADEQYLSLFGDMKTTYNRWRQYSRELLLYIRDDESRAAGQRHQFRRGSFAWLTATYGNYEWFRRQEQLMVELSSGFNNEVVPTVLQLEDSVVNLSGDLETQYAQWRSILQSLFELERGELAP